MKGFGNWVRDSRCRREWSQRKLALKANLSNTEISRIEKSADVNARIDVILRLSAAFNTPFIDMLVDAGVLDVSDLGGYVKLTDGERKLINDYNLLDERGQDAVLETVKRELRYQPA